MTIKEYIEIKMPMTLHTQTEDDGMVFGLPRPYNAPCADGMFQEMFYWDTYFTNRGHLAAGNVEQAKNNVDNLIYLANRFGFVLNASRREFLNNSQPPFLSDSVREVYAVTGDREWLRGAYAAIETEYKFWMESRTDESGLAHYDAIMPLPDWQIDRGADMLIERLGYTPDCDRVTVARGLFSVGESGWDITPRFTYRTYDYIAIDLNCLIFSMEKNMAYFAAELGLAQEVEVWENRAGLRAERCRALLRADDGIFYDYDKLTKGTKPLYHAASLYPLYFGMATAEEAETVVKLLLPHIVTEWGVLTCDKSDEVGQFQWGYPNGWPPLQMIAVHGLIRYGYTAEAIAIARGFVRTIERSFDETGHIWEKYNVVEGNANAAAEYETPTMLGWTYGAYVEFKKLLGEEI